MLLTEKEAAERMGIKCGMLRTQRLLGQASYVKIRRHYYYTTRQLQEFLSERFHPAAAYLTPAEIAEFNRVPDELALPQPSPAEVAIRERNPKLAGQIFRRRNRPFREIKKL